MMKQDTAPQEACAGRAPDHEKKTTVRPRMNTSMNLVPAMMMRTLSLHKNCPDPPVLQPTQWIV